MPQDSDVIFRRLECSSVVLAIAIDRDRSFPGCQGLGVGCEEQGKSPKSGKEGAVNA